MKQRQWDAGCRMAEGRSRQHEGAGADRWHHGGGLGGTGVGRGGGMAALASGVGHGIRRGRFAGFQGFCFAGEAFAFLFLQSRMEQSRGKRRDEAWQNLVGG